MQNAKSVYIFDELITRFVLIEGDSSKYNFFWIWGFKGCKLHNQSRGITSFSSTHFFSPVEKPKNEIFIILTHFENENLGLEFSSNHTFKEGK